MLIDSVIWIALKNERDKWYEKVIPLKEKIFSQQEIYITDNIIAETYNYLLRKVSYGAAKSVLHQFITNSRIIILTNNRLSINATYEIAKNYERLSYTDANIVWHATNRNISEVMSFDDDFDGVDDIIRIYQ